jgi:UDP-N-acetylmuramate-alanine ligase
MGREYVHHAVNHSKEFVDDDGHHTNNMEASWRTIKMKVPSRKRNHNILQEHLFEVMWRNQNVGEVWQSLLNALQEIMYGYD